MTTPSEIVFRAFGRERRGPQVGSVGARPDAIVLYRYPSRPDEPELLRIQPSNNARKLGVRELGNARIVDPEASALAVKLLVAVVADTGRDLAGAKGRLRDGTLILERLDAVPAGEVVEIAEGELADFASKPSRRRLFRRRPAEELKDDPHANHWRRAIEELPETATLNPRGARLRGTRYFIDEPALDCLARGVATRQAAHTRAEKALAMARRRPRLAGAKP